MKIANICPTSLLREVIDDEETYHLVLCSHILNDKAYAEFYRERSDRGDFVILDNDAYENRFFDASSSIEDLIRAADIVKPTEIVLPDTWDSNAVRALKDAEEAAYALRHLTFNGTTSFMAVPHGDNWKDFVGCVKRMRSIPLVNCLGIYKGIESTMMISRTRIALALGASTDLHFLGMTDDMYEMLPVYNYVMRGVRGIDSSKLIRWGLEGDHVTVDNIPEYPRRGDHYFDMESISPSQLEAIRHNISYWRSTV